MGEFLKMGNVLGRRMNNNQSRRPEGKGVVAELTGKGKGKHL
jgi:actin-like ATPase involved in cell morphogenesis